MNTPSPPTVPGCAPQVPVHDRVMASTVSPENSWAAAMAQIKPQAGLANDHETTQPKGNP